MDRQAIEALGDGPAGTGSPLIVTSGLPVIPGRVATEDDVPPPGAPGMPRLGADGAGADRSRGGRHGGADAAGP